MPNPTLRLPHTFYSSKEKKKSGKGIGNFKNIKKNRPRTGAESRIRAVVGRKSMTVQYKSWRTSEFKES